MSAETGFDAARERRGLPIKVAGIAALVAIPLVALAFMAWSAVDPEALRRQARDAVAVKRWDEAEAALARIPDPTPADWLLRAAVAHSRKDDDAASRHLARVPADGPLAAQASLMSAQVAQGRHHARAMEADLRRALAADPKLTAARRLLVYLFGLQQRRAEILEQFAAMAEQGPVTFDLLQHWCLSRGEIGEPVEVKPDLEAFLAADPDDLATRIALADVDRKLGQFDRAEATLAPATSANSDARAVRAQLAIDRGDIPAAAALLAEGPADHPRLARMRGRLALSRRDGAAALAALRISDAAEPCNPETLFVLAQALRLAGEKAEAERVAKRSADYQALRTRLGQVTLSQAGSPEYLMSLGSACEEIGLIPEARAWYRLVITLDPLNSGAQRALHRLASAELRAGSRPSARDSKP